MSKRSRRKQRYLVETQPAEVRKVSLEIKEVVERDEDVEKGEITIRYTFTNGSHFDVRTKRNSWEYYSERKNKKKGDIVTAVVRCMRIDNIY